MPKKVSHRASSHRTHFYIFAVKKNMRSRSGERLKSACFFKKSWTSFNLSVVF